MHELNDLQRRLRSKLETQRAEASIRPAVSKLAPQPAPAATETNSAAAAPESSSGSGSRTRKKDKRGRRTAPAPEEPAPAQADKPEHHVTFVLENNRSYEARDYQRDVAQHKRQEREARQQREAELPDAMPAADDVPANAMASLKLDAASPDSNQALPETRVASPEDQVGSPESDAIAAAAQPAADAAPAEQRPSTDGAEGGDEAEEGEDDDEPEQPGGDGSAGGKKGKKKKRRSNRSKQRAQASAAKAHAAHAPAPQHVAASVGQPAAPVPPQQAAPLLPSQPSASSSSAPISVQVEAPTFPLKMPLRTDSYTTDTLIYVHVYRGGLSVRNITATLSSNARLLKLTFHDFDGNNSSVMDVALPAPAASVARVAVTKQKAEVQLVRAATDDARPSITVLTSPPEKRPQINVNWNDASPVLDRPRRREAESSLEDVSSLFGAAEDMYQTVQAPEEVPTGPITAPSCGLTGLVNLGNTCFLNSTLQCLSGAQSLTRFFISDAYAADINETNPLGMRGDLAREYAMLMKRMWTPGARPYISPLRFKSAVGKFRPQFSGNQQHDAQEVLAFLLDGLHEDLNRVKAKPYTENPEYAGQPDAELAAACWSTHRRRNDSVVVDLFQGQYKSTVTCQVCSKVSVAFDPYMFLSLPLPQAPTPQLVHLTRAGGSRNIATRLRVHVPKGATADEVCEAIAAAAGVRPDRLLLVEHDNGVVQRVFAPNEAVGAPAVLYAYETEASPTDKGHAIVCAQMRSFGSDLWECDNCGKQSLHLPRCARCKAAAYCDEKCMAEHYPRHKAACAPRYSYFGQPWFAVLPLQELTRGRLLAAFVEGISKHIDASMVERWQQQAPVQLSHNGKRLKMTPDSIDKLVMPGEDNFVALTVDWDNRDVDKFYDSARARDYVLKYDDPPPQRCSLDDCMQLSFERELLENDNAWYCPSCKTHQTASKQLQLWTVPPILVVHLKRFSSGRSNMSGLMSQFASMLFRAKLTTPVDFPLTELDMSPYLLNKSVDAPPIYDLFGVSHHFGGTSGGHYTAHGLRRSETDGSLQWYYFDDDRVSPAGASDVVVRHWPFDDVSPHVPVDRQTPSAYVLFYKRRDVSIDESAGLAAPGSSEATPPATAAADGKAADDVAAPCQ